MINRDENAREYSEGLLGLVCDKTVSHEVSGDHILPDYQPEIRRILSVSEKILPPAKYVSHSGVECNGNIDYKILYVGVDGGLYSANMSAEYDLTVPVEDAGEFELSNGVQTVVHTVCDGSSARVSSPRKINIKSRLSSHVRAYAQLGVSEEIYGEYDAELERLYRDVENARVLSIDSDPIELTDDISGVSEDTRVISADGEVYVKDVRRDGVGADVSGEVMIKVLSCREGQSPELMTRSLPLSERIEWGENMNEPLCKIKGDVTDITVNVGEGRISCGVSVNLNAVAAENLKCRYIADVYSTERECECDRTELLLPTVALCANGNFSQSERLPMSEAGIPEGADIIDAFCVIRFDSSEYTGEKYIFTGNSKYTLLCEKEGEFSSCEFQLPVKYETSGIGGDAISSDIAAETVSCRVRLDGDVLRVDSEIAVCVDAVCINKVSAVKGIRLGDDFGKSRCRMVVYYPADGESEWEVAKRYHVPAGSLKAEKNYYLF